MLVTISDKKIGVDQNTDGNVDYYTADVITAQDYYPFGQLQPGRQYGALGRHGFNGKEQDPETKGTGAQYDYGFRIYDPRLGRFLSVDPLTRTYPMLTPYQFASNTPIQAIDLDGLEAYHYIRFKDKEGKPVLALLEQKDIIEKKLVRTESQMVDNGMGGVSIDKIDVYEEVKNARQEYVVWSLDQFDQIPYDEKRTFKTLQEAENSTDEDFEGTTEDYKAAISITLGKAFAPTAFDFGRWPTRPRGGKARRLQTQFHHVIVRNLKNTSAFVQKAIKGGFKIDGVKNLLPVTRFLKRYNMGVHAKHPKYTKQVSDHLESVDISKMSDANAAKYLNQMSDYIIDRIKANKGVKINDIDLKLGDFKFKE